MELILIRHLPVDIDGQLCYGQTDVPLKRPYQQKLEEIAASLPKADACYSSPLSRCAQLAEEIDDHFITDDRLLEMHFGDWEMQSWDTIYELPYGKQWMNNYTQLNTPGGESFQDVWERSLSFLNMLKNTPHNRVVIVTHAGVIRTICAIIDQVSITRAFELPVAYGQIFHREW